MRPLSLGLAAALASSAIVAVTTKASAPALNAPAVESIAGTSGASRRPDVQTTWTVQNCDDSGANSLRDIIENPVNAKSGDIVDLSQLPMLCGMADSIITLGAEIVVSQNDLTLLGPAAASGNVMLSGNDASRVLNHEGSGTLSIEALTLANGAVHAAGPARGGCVYSKGNVYLQQVVATGCSIISDTASAAGGGIYSVGDTHLVFSTISGNKAMALQNSASGAGLSVRGSLTTKYSAISSNKAYDGAIIGDGGGAEVSAGATLISSTFDQNSADRGSAVWVGSGETKISNSTISENEAVMGPAIYIRSNSAVICNSTIAFNRALTNSYSAVVFAPFPPPGTLDLESSIVAGNLGHGEPEDLYVMPPSALSGADNLVVASNVSPPGVISVTTDPKLGPLQFNGGHTMTHQLLSGSPAVGIGNVTQLNPPFNIYDQRGIGYPRTTGPSASVDIGAVQFDRIFVDGLDLQ
jgi:hypothetical protein